MIVSITDQDVQVPTCIYGTPFCFDNFDHTICSVSNDDAAEAERILVEKGSIFDF